MSHCGTHARAHDVIFRRTYALFFGPVVRELPRLWSAVDIADSLIVWTCSRVRCGAADEAVPLCPCGRGSCSDPGDEQVAAPVLLAWRRPCVHCGHVHVFTNTDGDLADCPACGCELYPIASRVSA